MPSWQIHKELASKAVSYVGSLQRELLDGILEGVVDPDVVADYCVQRYTMPSGEVKEQLVRKRHHVMNVDLIRYYYRLALYFYRRGDIREAGRALGRAMHYLHDGLLETRWSSYDFHDVAEEDLDRLWPPTCSPRRMTLRQAVAMGPSKGREALCKMLEASIATISTFLKDIQRPTEHVYRNYRKAEIAFTLSLASLFTIFLGAPFWLPLLFILPTGVWYSFARDSAEAIGLIRPKLHGCRTAM